MLAYQRGLLERLVRHACALVPFYRDQKRLEPLFKSDDTIDWSRWTEIPVLTRREAQRNEVALYAEVVPPECGDVVSGYTAGSTGTPLAYRVNSLVAAAGSAVLERGFMWSGLPANLSLAGFRNDRKGECSYPAGLTYRSTIRGTTRLMHHLAVQTPIEDQCRWLADIRPDVVMGYPGALALLADYLPEKPSHHFKLVVCVGEVTTEHIRETIEKRFGCAVMDLYSGSEFGPVAIEDSRYRCMYLCEELTFVEYNQSNDFESSKEPLVELIFTPFYNYAMPLIRYACGDFAVCDTIPSPDSRTLRRLKRIVGRQRNYFVLPSGRRWWPTYQNKVLCDFLDYRQIQFAQTAPDRVEIRYASDLPEPVKDAEQLSAYLRSATPEPMDIVLTRVSEIARRESGKYEYATCEIDQLSTTHKP
ncbi:MAG: hypothetical protein QOF09_3183 [Alphaproteobacteria bacterium]|nr:hypothetical protein [Alphaproteobacteria bacterium]